MRAEVKNKLRAAWTGRENAGRVLRAGPARARHRTYLKTDKGTSKGRCIDRLGVIFSTKAFGIDQEGWTTVDQKPRWWEVRVEVGLATFIAEWRRKEDAETTARHVKVAGKGCSLLRCGRRSYAVYAASIHSAHRHGGDDDIKIYCILHISHTEDTPVGPLDPNLRTRSEDTHTSPNNSVCDVNVSCISVLMLYVTSCLSHINASQQESCIGTMSTANKGNPSLPANTATGGMASSRQAPKSCIATRSITRSSW